MDRRGATSDDSAHENPVKNIGEMQSVAGNAFDVCALLRSQISLATVERNEDGVLVLVKVQRQAAANAMATGSFEEMRNLRVAIRNRRVPYQRRGRLPSV